MRLTVSQMKFLNASSSLLVIRKENGGFRVTDFPLNVESPNASLHVDEHGYVTTGHNEKEVKRILSQIK